MLQFIAPTMQFLIAVLLYGESFTRWHAVAFGAIWIALALYVASLVQSSRASSGPPAPRVTERLRRSGIACV